MTTRTAIGAQRRIGVRNRWEIVGLWVAIVTLSIATAVTTPRTVEAVALFDSSGAPTNLITQPNNYQSFEDNPITWTMTPEFLAAYPLAKHHEQVRLAFREWERASTEPLRRLPAAPYSFVRYGGPQPFADLRSVMVHEIGHALGSQHTDASWFNDSDPGPAFVPFNRNYRPDGMGGWIAGPPLGGEVMNEGNAPGLPDVKPDKGLRGGEYWRLVSQDELAMLDYVYPNGLDFVEVPNNQDADIIIGVFTGGECGENLGVGGPDGGNFRDPNDATQGVWISTSSVAIRDNPSSAGPVGIKARVSSWELTNTGQPITEANIRTRGTDNENPISKFSQGNHAFTSIQGMPETFPFEFEDLTFRFSNPQGGPVPNGEAVSMTLQLDVWDWSVVSTDFETSVGGFVSVSLVNIFDWFAATPGPDPCEEENGLHIRPSDIIEAAGFQLLNSDLATRVTEVGFAPIAGLGLTGADLGSELLGRLRSLGLLEEVPDFEPIELGAGEEFVFVLEGERADLPPELVARGNYAILNRPELMDGELLAYAITQGANGTVVAFSLLNGGVFVPEPSAMGMLLAAVVGCGIIRWRRS